MMQPHPHPHPHPHPSPSRKEPLSKLGQRPPRTFAERFWSKVNQTSCDGCWIWTACLGSTGYGQIKSADLHRTLSAHRVAWEMFNGPLPSDVWLDHACGNRACVNPEHLRVCTPQENAYNKVVAKNNRTGLKGVWRSGNRWRATIKANGVVHRLGSFDSAEKAHQAYQEASIRLHLEFSNTGGVR